MALEHSRKVGRIYAGALFEIAKAKGIVGKVDQELEQIEKLYDESTEFHRFFTSPRVTRPEKRDALKEMFAGKISETTLNLLYVLVDKARETAFDNVVDAWQRYRDEAEDRVHVWIRSATPLDDSQREQIKQKLTRHGNEIVLHETVDASLVGGVIIKVHDYIVDSSLKSKLRDLSREVHPHAGSFY